MALAGALFLAALAVFGASIFFEKGEALFVQNKPQDARPLLENALNDDPSNEKIYLYLGIIYQQLGDPQKAIDVLKKGLNVATAFKDLFYYNMGNDFFSRKEYAFAEDSYNSALSANHNLAEAYLNRANSRLQLQNYAGALADYTLFLQMKPQDPQRPNIEKVMALIRGVQDDIEKARQAELAKQQALMNDVLNSLNNAGEDTKNLSVESIKGQNDPVSVDIKD
jgi:tetratricopeptide (TPR) repeat protein